MIEKNDLVFLNENVAIDKQGKMHHINNIKDISNSKEKKQDQLKNKEPPKKEKEEKQGEQFLKLNYILINKYGLRVAGIHGYLKQKCTYSKLKDKNGNKYFTRTYESVAKELNLSVDYVKKSLNILKKDNLIIIKKIAGNKNAYYINE